MRGTVAKEIRRIAEAGTIGQPAHKTRALIKLYKRGYFARNHPGGEPATRTSYFCCRPASAERQRLIQSRFDPKA